jgi:sortase (surface protein transpeptidase)
MPKLVNGVVVALVAAGLVLAFVGSHTLRWSPPTAPQKWEAPSRSRPQPPAPRAPSGGQAAVRTVRVAGNRYQVTPMAHSVPVSVYIPHIKVRAEIISLGLTSSGAVGVPSLNTPFLTSWYNRGPTPGSPGAAVIFGHVDSAAVGPAVFYHIGDLLPGDLVYVTLKDGRTALFRVYSAALYSKAEFPDNTIYGYTSWPSLRLITCGGQFDSATGHYLSNTVVFAQYVGQQAGASRS